MEKSKVIICNDCRNPLDVHYYNSASNKIRTVEIKPCRVCMDKLERKIFAAAHTDYEIAYDNGYDEGYEWGRYDTRKELDDEKIY